MKPKLKGFTFIEIMVVLVIIAIMVTAIGISVSAFNSKIKPGPFSYYLKQVFELIEQRAILEQNDFGICVYKKGMIFYRYNQKESQYNQIENSTEIKNIQFPDTLSISLNINNEFHKLADNICNSPNLIFNSGGFITPFKLSISENELRFSVTANYAGGLDVKQEK